MMKRTIALTGMFLVGAASGLLGCGGPIPEQDGNAAESVQEIPEGLEEHPAAAELAARTAAPTCVQRVLAGPKRLNIANTCGTTRWAKVIIAFGPDSSCFSMTNGRLVSVTWHIGSYDGLVDC
ncbi:MAG TPA: hypothetical protein VGL19_10675, partial [Polyangiaceae bacterium]